MKRAQIMIVFVLAVLRAFFAADETTPTAGTTTVFQGNVTEKTSSTAENGTTPIPIPTTTISSVVTTEPTSTVGSNATTAATPDIFTTTDTSSVEPTSISSVSSVSTSISTSSPTDQTTAAPVCPPLSGFDGASFVGGIVLALGVIVILGIAVKCYNHQTRKNELQYSQF